MTSRVELVSVRRSRAELGAAACGLEPGCSMLGEFYWAMSPCPIACLLVIWGPSSLAGLDYCALLAEESIRF